ncbi:aromatic ring-opening dioxygenase family protein [Apiospora kogelbergensis]|uniref:Aromatic ring-opening dioxygenase family protein n=1 Tax=Apiospora kogelbergensis TaxID=1337665 RepID=A0AAW0QKD6_9PEZI
MAVGKRNTEEPMAPVHLFSHGSTMMLGEESASADYWKKCGDEALAHGVEHVVMMGAHWATSLPGVLISAHPKPGKSPVAYVDPSKYQSYALNPDLAYVPVLQEALAAAGIPSAPDATFDWIHDTYLVLIRMFPGGCPPTTIVSMNQTYDPHFHMSVGAALRPLRAWPRHRTLFVGSGGAVHNLYRNVWGPMLRYRDNFAQPTPPEPWALDFRQEVVAAFCPGHEEAVPADEAVSGRVIRSNRKQGRGAGGPLLRRKITSLMKHPKYRDAHGTDDHFMATMFVAGLCGGRGDENMVGEMGAEDWELTNMCNSQFTLGSWADVKE